MLALWGDLEQVLQLLCPISSPEKCGEQCLLRGSLRGPSESAQQSARSSGPRTAMVVLFHCETSSVKLRRMLPFPPEIPAVRETLVKIAFQ